MLPLPPVVIPLEIVVILMGAHLIRRYLTAGTIYGNFCCFVGGTLVSHGFVFVVGAVIQLLY